MFNMYDLIAKPKANDNQAAGRDIFQQSIDVLLAETMADHMIQHLEKMPDDQVMYVLEYLANRTNNLIEKRKGERP